MQFHSHVYTTYIAQGPKNLGLNTLMMYMIEKKNQHLRF